jgi:penicillin-binding protein 2
VIAIAVVVENAGFGATWAAPIASLMMEQYILGKIDRHYLFDRISTSILNPDVQKR